MRAMLAHQADDGMWRQVVDEQTSYKELTVTAMTISVMARGIRLGWLDKSFRPAVDRAWQSVLTRIGADGSVADVCSGTGAGATKDYYMTRPATSGAHDRGGAMALTAALEMAELSRRQDKLLARLQILDCSGSSVA
jgi:rhamnogalacturonyl hydrolase YesR